MRYYKTSMIGALAAVAMLAGCAPSVTTRSLLDQMTDFQRLAELSEPAYVTLQASSYDRKSKTADDAEGWFANADHGQFIREEANNGRKEFVMMDADGPGAIVRIWSANPKGNLRIYLDGNAEPVLEAPMTDLLGGKVEGLPVPLAGERARGWNLYFPIPYAKHCKVTSDEGGFYYHVNYRTYEPDTRVQTFTAGQLESLAKKIQKIAGQLAEPRYAMAPPDNAVKHTFSACLPAGREKVVAELEGPQAICALRATLSSVDIPAAARGVIVCITFDGEQTVECPLGDFFGTSPGLAVYESLPMGITEDDPQVLWSHWFMPFAESATITLKNMGEEAACVKGGVAAVPYRWTERSLLFHAKWRIERGLPARPFSDWTHLACEGTGRFVGGAVYVSNPVRNWWGEGDEKIYVDGETFPSHFGTGSEDYYGYAWCCNEPFMHAYHNQPRCDGPRNFGHTSNSRFHIIDDIPFTSSFKFDMENWHSNSSAKTDRAAVSFWYALPGGTDSFAPITPADAAKIEELKFKATFVPGAIEGEKLREIKVPGNCRIEQFAGDLSGDEHLWWEKGKPGDKLVLGFLAPAGRKHLIVRLTRNNDYAIVQLYLNDKKVGEPIDCYAKRFKPTEEMDLGECEFVEGENKLTVEIVGINDKAAKNYEFAIDYLKIQ